MYPERLCIAAVQLGLELSVKLGLEIQLCDNGDCLLS